MNKRLLILVTEYYYFRSHKQDLAKCAKESGFDVRVATRIGNHTPDRDGISAINVDWTRSNSLVRAATQFFPEVLNVRRLLKQNAPTVLHNIALKPSIIGSLAALNIDVKVINSVNGFGFLFYDRSILARIAQKICGFILRLSIKRNGAVIVLQNKDDLRFAEATLGVRKDRLRLIPGSGVDTEQFKLATPCQGPSFRFLVLARLLRIKGIEIAIDAHKTLRASGYTQELVVCGGYDPDNPSAISPETVSRWSDIPGITFMGHVEDVRPVLTDSDVVVQPSLGGEGLPKSLLEAAAFAKPMIASDVPGNREIVLNDITGLLVEPGNADSLAEAMKWAMTHPDSLVQWGTAARQKVVAEFSAQRIMAQHAQLYSDTIATEPA